MSEEFQAHVFDSFSRERTSTQSGIKGTGLGMAITRNIVAMTANAFEELNNLHKEEHFLFLSIRNNVIMCLENKKIK